jgi:hypothetical protein
VRTGPSPTRSGPSPEISVVWPTRTPGTSVIAFAGPGGRSPITIPRSRALGAVGGMVSWGTLRNRTVAVRYCEMRIEAMSANRRRASSTAHPGGCRWFWAWAAVGFGLVLGFVGIFSIGPFLLPFVTLLLGIACARRTGVSVIAAGLVAATVGIAAGVSTSQWAFLVTPPVTLAIGISPAVRRSIHGVLQAAVIAVVVVACAVAALGAAPAGPAVLVVMPLGLTAFALAVGGRLDAEVAGAITGAGVAALLLGAPPTSLLLIAAGIAAFPVLRGPARAAAG